ncbi:ATP-binding protein [uncultured Bacteroides sp.]|uniref:ATP-binding protein n=1 Tax=uncultured Bacteroides sp. TaxID=162156 RepID=UPI0025ECE6BA|nr:ATP-binding protein [uncultured Bacteroides sp.]
MASIEIKHVGPLNETSKIDLKMVNLFIGKQSTGKSTLMKILSYCRWLEKTIMTGSDTVLSAYTHNNRFLKELMQFYRFNTGYFSNDSEIHYQGDCVTIHLNGIRSNARIERLSAFDDGRYNTKLSFIPSERNLLAAIKNIDRSYRVSDLDVLFNFIFEWGEAKDLYTNSDPKTLAIAPNMEYYFDKEKGTDIIRLKDKRKEFTTFYAPSGVQSALPVEILVEYVCGMAGQPVSLSKGELYDMMNKFLRERASGDKLTETNGEILSSHLLNYQSAQLFIEELEQNLYPESQWNLVRSIINAIKKASVRTGHNSMVTLTTHSPYVLTALNVLMVASAAWEKDSKATSEIVPENYILPTGSIGAYYLTEEGTLKDIVDAELHMVSGLELDGISDLVDESIAALNSIIYG